MNVIEQAAARLIGAAETQVPCAPVRDLLGAEDVDTAYAVQDHVAVTRESRGGRVMGCKVGLTSVAVQQQFGVHQPDFGVLFDDMVHSHGTTLDLGAFLQPRVEAEVAFVLGTALPLTRPTVADLIRATAFVLPAIEVVDSRIAGWDITIADTIADNASSGAVVLGTSPRHLGDLDLAEVGMVLEQDGEEVGSGAGVNCLGSPVVAATWVAGEMARRGRSLQAGDLVLSGALGPMVDVVGPATFRAELDPLGAVEVTFTRQERS